MTFWIAKCLISRCKIAQPSHLIEDFEVWTMLHFPNESHLPRKIAKTHLNARSEPFAYFMWWLLEEKHHGMCHSKLAFEQSAWSAWEWVFPWQPLQFVWHWIWPPLPARANVEINETPLRYTNLINCQWGNFKCFRPTFQHAIYVNPKFHK